MMLFQLPSFAVLCTHTQSCTLYTHSLSLHTNIQLCLIHKQNSPWNSMLSRILIKFTSPNKQIPLATVERERQTKPTEMVSKDPHGNHEMRINCGLSVYVWLARNSLIYLSSSSRIHDVCESASRDAKICYSVMWNGAANAYIRRRFIIDVAEKSIAFFLGEHQIIDKRENK